MLCPSCRAEIVPGATRCGLCGQALGALAPGTLFASRYEVLALVGQGGMGTVYKARDRELDEVVALKMLRPDVTGTPEMKQRFRSEIRLARRVSHRNVCRVHDYGTAQGLHYVCMALVEGVDLKRLLASRGPLPLDRAYDLCAQVADGLQAIHDEGIVHRDLKSANIMVEPRGVARLMDFGIAKPLDPALAHGMTATGVIVGTPEYMSPEQALGGAVDARSDVYSLGVVTFEAFTGRVPFRGDTPVATILLHVHQPPPLEGPSAAGLPPEVVPLLRRALAKTRAERPASAREFADGLRAAWGERAAAGAVTPASPATVTLRGAVAAAITPLPAPASVSVPAATPTTVPVTTLVTTPAPAAVAAVSARPVLPLPTRPTGGGRSRRRRTALEAAVVMVALGVSVAVLLRTRAVRPGVAPPPVSASPVPSPAPDAGRTPGTQASSAPAAATGSEPLAPKPPATSRRAGATPSPTPSPTPAPAPAVAAPGRLAEAQAYLVVVVVPWADVSLDGAPVKTVPMRRLPLAPGQHVVRLVHPDYQPLQRVVTARPGETVTLTVDLPEEGVRIGK